MSKKLQGNIFMLGILAVYIAAIMLTNHDLIGRNVHTVVFVFGIASAMIQFPFCSTIDRLGVEEKQRFFGFPLLKYPAYMMLIMLIAGIIMNVIPHFPFIASIIAQSILSAAYMVVLFVSITKIKV